MKKRETKLLFLFAIAWCAAFLAYFGTGSQYPCFGPSVAELETTQSLPESSTDGGSYGSATSGKLFSGNVIRRFDVAKKLGPLSSSNSGALKKSLTFPGPKCRYWSVTTTIFEPSEAMQIQANLGDEWCIVIAGDRKGSNTYDLRRSSDNSDSRIVYLSAKKQEELEEKNFEFIRQLPWNHFGRKNIGYLYAIANEAEYIWDFDDDNALIDKNSKHIVTPCNDESKDHVTLSVLPPSLNNCRSYNPYPAMGAPILPCWPRGLPLDDIKSEPCVLASNASLLSTKSVPRSSLAVCQSLAQHDPDVDAIYRLTQPLPINFLQDVSSPTSVMVPRHALTPFNAQATMFSRDSHWMLLLPITVHGRVSDIWRSYAGQRLLKEIGLEVVFTPALVVQD